MVFLVFFGEENRTRGGHVHEVARYVIVYFIITIKLKLRLYAN